MVCVPRVLRLSLLKKGIDSLQAQGDRPVTI
jgi:hypothetical protein